MTDEASRPGINFGEMMNLLTTLTGHSKQTFWLHIKYSPERVYVSHDESTNSADCSFNAGVVTIEGIQIQSSGKTIDDALASLAEEILRTLHNHARRAVERTEEAVRTFDAYRHR